MEGRGLGEGETKELEQVGVEDAGVEGVGPEFWGVEDVESGCGVEVILGVVRGEVGAAMEGKELFRMAWDGNGQCVGEEEVVAPVWENR